MGLRLAFLFVAFFVAACTTVTDPPRASYSSLKAETRQERGDILVRTVAAQRRLLEIGAPLLTANASLCPRRRSVPGFEVVSDFDMPRALQDVAMARVHLNRDARVLAVFAGGPADRVGVRTGDVLAAIDGRPVRNAAEVRARLRRKHDARTMGFGFLRDGVAYDARISFIPTCAYRLVYVAGAREINAYTDGERIFVTQGMMDFANDRELAAVIGHELAHIVMQHIPKQTLNRAGIEIIGGAVTGLLGVLDWNGTVAAMLDAYTQAYSESFEIEADYVGAYLLARAGGDTGAIAPFWRRMAAENGLDSVSLPVGELRTHPDTPKRFVVMTRTDAEIRDKMRHGVPLMPELMHGFAYGKPFWPWESDADADEEPDDSDLNH
ncbi:MAG: M48 family metalloprotease [Rhodospirillales bacterium]|nr:M48 family metalloprotease [Alphaproteobacteria bacterium]MCB9986160.1 M48 family metalloprotease [Rhodospirillales bacterium]USO07282.1 MAG: M48 family metalloprotease [Rhodospirillales bacterium]